MIDFHQLWKFLLLISDNTRKTFKQLWFPTRRGGCEANYALAPRVVGVYNARNKI